MSTKSTKGELILHPIRMRLVSELGNREMTTRELAAALPDIAQATLYRQIKRLQEGGIFHVTNEQVVNGAVERTYGLVANQSRLTAEDVANLSAEEHMQYFSVFAAGLIDSFSRYLEQAETPLLEPDGASYNQAIIYLSDEERVAFQEQLLNIVGKVLTNKADEKRKKYTLASVVIPDVSNQEVR
ncbi:MAG: helix-turn-helix domain-containing protein [Anaerolineae bacterium]